MASTPTHIRLLLVEDNRLLREGITAILKSHKDFRVAHATGTKEEILKKIRSFKPHVLLLDLAFRDLNSLTIVKDVKASVPTTRIVAMDLVPAENDILAYVRAGVSGFILKDATTTEFLHTIRSVARGSEILPSPLTSSLFSQIVDHAMNGTAKPASMLMASVRLTRRERQVIELISAGLANKEIAQQLHLSTYTIKSHVHNILEKLAIHSRVQIARYAHTSQGFEDAADTVSLLEE